LKKQKNKPKAVRRGGGKTQLFFRFCPKEGKKKENQSNDTKGTVWEGKVCGSLRASNQQRRKERKIQKMNFFPLLPGQE